MATVEVVSYGLPNAMFQWEEGERRVTEAPGVERRQLEDAATEVTGELRRRLGGSYSVGELAELYSSGTDWAEQIAHRAGAGTDSAWVVDACFFRYASGASDFAGGRSRSSF
jgi:hypothetical protein